MQPKAKKGPKKGRSSYIFFSMEQRKSAEISALPFAEAGKAISEKYRTRGSNRTSSASSPTSSPLPVARRWKEVSAEEKAAYDDMAKVDKMRHQREQERLVGLSQPVCLFPGSNKL